MKTLLLICLLLSQMAFSQKIDVKFGEISEEEIEMKGYDKDKESKAVILFDKGKSVFFDTDTGYDIRFTRHKRIKIFKKSESKYTEVSIPFYVDGFGRTEKVKSIEAVTYNFEGGRVIKKKLDLSKVYEEKINERWYNKKFVFPDVQNGSILEYRYILETPFHFNLPDWRFQDKIPTKYSEYQVSMIPFYEYVFIAQGISRFDYKNSEVAKEKRSFGTVIQTQGQRVGSGVEFQDYTHTYVLKDVPAFKDESYISSIDDYIAKMDFQLAKLNYPRGGSSEIISTWPALNEALIKHEKFGKYLKSSAKYAKKILSEELDLSELNSEKKAKEIINYVKNSFVWNGYYGKYASQSPKSFVQKKSGNDADINLFMVALLNEAAINTKPVILSTRSHGKIQSDYPFDHFTNYVIALVEFDSPFMADATENLLPYDKLPLRCNNDIGLIVEKGDNTRWLSLNNSITSLEKNTLRLNIEKTSLDIKAEVSVQATEYNSFSSRKRFKNDSLKIKDFYADRVGTISKVNTTGYERRNLPYTVHFKTSYETEKLGENIVVKPFLNLPLSKNNLTQKKRNYPVDFIYPWEDSFESYLEITNDFSITELPDEYHIANDLAEVDLSYSIKDNLLIAKGYYKFKKSTYVASEYARIRHYLDQVVKYFNQPIVLKKKS